MVGLGTVAEDHLRALSLNPRTELTAVCDLDESLVEEATDAYDTRGFTDYERMLDEADLDWVHVCTPVQTHFALASTAIERGVDVLVEKPITETYDEYERLQARADEAGVRLTEVHSALFHYEVRWIREQVEAGEVGDVKSVEVYFGEDIAPDSLVRGEWVLDLPGGELEEGFPHPIYSALRLGGYPADVDDVDVSTVLAGEYDHDFDYDGVLVSFASENDALCSVHIQSNVPNQKTVRVHGTAGSLEADVTYHSLLPFPTAGDPDYLHTSLSALRRDANRLLRGARNLANTARLYANELSYYKLADALDRPVGTLNRQMYHQIDAEARSLIEGTPSPIPTDETAWTQRIIDRIRAAPDDATDGPDGRNG
jgi:predicted dehydrogenase